MPLCILALIAQMPNLIAEIEAIMQAMNVGGATPNHYAKLASYSAAVGAINGIVAYHANVGA